MDKYNEMVLSALSKDEIKSANLVLEESQEETGKIIDWPALHRIFLSSSKKRKLSESRAKSFFLEWGMA